MKFVKRLLIALLNILFGIVVGLFLLEIILRANPKLLLRGMSVPIPVDPSLIVQTYDVHYSDADVFYWRPDLIHPIAPEDDLIEAHVHYATDELGFRNQPPTSQGVDFVVLGSSFSVGAQVETSWPELLAGKNDWKFLNLAQPASTLDIQLYYLQQYARPHQPHWVVIEVMPMLSILGYAPQPPLLIQQLASPFIQ